MRRLLLATAAAAVMSLAYANAATAGCSATVGLAPPPPSVGPGEPWAARMTVLQHGRNPLPDAPTARPRLTIVNEATGAERTFVARPTGDPAVFEAAVTFPSAGRWRYEVFDDFTSDGGEPAPCARTHTFAAVTVGSSGGGGTPAVGATGFPVWPAAGGSLALAGAAVGAALLRRRRAERAPASRPGSA